jgi:hypothetical protein
LEEQRSAVGAKNQELVATQDRLTLALTASSNLNVCLKRAMATLYVMQNHIFLVLTGKRSTKI